MTRYDVHQVWRIAEAPPHPWPIARPLGFTMLITGGFVIASSLGYGIGMAIADTRGGAIGLTIARLLIAVCASIGLFVLVPAYRPLLHGPQVHRDWLYGAVPLLIMALVVPLLSGSGYGAYQVSLITWLREASANVPIGVAEEFVFRGLIFAVLLAAYARQTHPILRAIGVSASAFALIHIINLFAGEGLAITLGQTVAGLLLGIFTCAIVVTTGSVWPAVLAHTGFVTIFGRMLAGADLGISEARLFILVYVPLALYGLALLRRSN